MKQLLLVLNISMQKVESLFVTFHAMVDALMKSLCSLKKKKKLSCIFQLKVCFIHKNTLQNTDPGRNPEDRCITWAHD